MTLRSHLILLGIVILIATGCGRTDDRMSVNKGDTLFSDDGFKIMSLQESDATDEYTLTTGENYLLIKSGLKEVRGNIDQENRRYVFMLDHGGINASCTAPLEFYETFELDCVIEGNACTYSLVKDQNSSTYLPGDDTSCILITRSLLNKPPIEQSSAWYKPFEKSLIPPAKAQSNIWGNECGAYSNERPELCPTIVHRENNNYYYKDSCYKPEATISSSSGITADETNLIRVDSVYSTSEHEGCFLFWCNGPWGNFHIILMPYAPELAANATSEQLYQRILEADKNRASNTYHGILRGAYFSRSSSSPDSEEERQCEWYDTNTVGPQQVHYDHRFVWDWNWDTTLTCTCDECHHLIMFTIYESDEIEIAHDPIAVGTVTYEKLLTGPITLSIGTFSITFRLENPRPFGSSREQPADSEQKCEAVGAAHTIQCDENPFGSNTVTPLGQALFTYECLQECNYNWAEEFAKCERRQREYNRDPDCQKRIRFLQEGCEEINYQQVCTIPSNFMIEIWEYSCIKHLQKCEYDAAENLLDTMNWQCRTKEGFAGLPQAAMEEGRKTLEEARAAKRKALSEGTPYVCDSNKFSKRDLSYLDCIKNSETDR